MRFVAGQEISIEALEKSRSRAVPELSGDIKFRSIASRDNEALGEPWHRLQPRQRFGQSRFRNRESLAHVHCRCLMAKAKTKYAHLTPALCPHPMYDSGGGRPLTSITYPCFATALRASTNWLVMKVIRVPNARSIKP